MLATGDVTLLAQCVEGQTESIQGFLTDQGTYPGPLSGVPATITFTCNVSHPKHHYLGFFWCGFFNAQSTISVISGRNTIICFFGVLFF